MEAKEAEREHNGQLGGGGKKLTEALSSLFGGPVLTTITGLPVSVCSGGHTVCSNKCLLNE